MAEENQNRKTHEYEPTVGSEGAVESKDRGLFDFLGKKEEEKPQHRQHQDQAIATEFEKAHVSEPKVEEHKGSEGAVESKDRGLFDFLGKKEEEKPQHHQHQDQAIATEFEKFHVSEPKVEEHKEEEAKEEKKPGIMEKLHRSKDSSSSSSSDEEEGDDEEKKKKKKEKKGLKETLKEKLSGDKGEKKHEDTTTVPVERVDEVAHHQEPAHPEEKGGFLDKVKEKLPGQHKKPEAEAAATIPETHRAEHATAEAHDSHEGEAKEKKGIFEKIKEKLPGYHSKTEEEKEKEKGSSAH